MGGLDLPFSAPEVGRQDVAALLQHTYSWARAAEPVVPSVAQQVASALTVAAQLYEAQQYGAAADRLSGVAWLVHQARQAYPALPEW